ncbi:MAG: S1 RNA-binding domain-containing protein [Patescibacteria group bacterium]
MNMTASLNGAKSMKDLLAKEEYHLPKPGQILTGTIIAASKSSVLVDLGSSGIGIVYPGQFYDNPDRMRALKPGDPVSTMLIELESDEGYRELSLKAAQLTTAWQRIRELRETGQVIATPIMNINKGGLIVQIEGVQGFLPLSQLAPEHYPRVEGGDTTKIVQALQKFKGQEFKVKVLDYSEQEHKLIVSERAIQEEVVKEELAKLSVGQIVEGAVTEVTDFGAFVRLSETLDGLIHSSEIDWKYVEDPRDVLQPGQTISAKIISLDGGRVSLSLKALKDNPWLTIQDHYQVDQKVQGRVIKVRANGIFVELPGDIVGLIPSTALTPEALAQFEVGREYPLSIVSIDPANHKIVLSPVP